MKLLAPLLLLFLSCKKDNTADQPNLNPAQTGDELYRGLTKYFKDYNEIYYSPKM